MHIAHVTATFPPYRGGTGNVCYHNARELARRGHAVTVLTAAVPGAPAVEELDGFVVRRLAAPLRAGNAPLLPELVPALRGFDIIHLHYPFFGGEITAAAAFALHTPLVVTYHQDVLLHGAKALVAAAITATLGRAVLRYAARVLYTSLDYSRHSSSRRLLHGREHSVGELPNGVDITRFRPGAPSPQLRRRFGISAEERVALLVARLDEAHHFKGVDVFLEALAQCPPTVRALIVGDGALLPAYRSRADQCGLGERVAFAGHVPDAELPDYYRTADVCVLPSVTMGEAFGLVLVESLASGTPVIASRLPGVRTVVDHGVDGLLV